MASVVQPALLTVELDRSSGIINSVGTGIWSSELLDSYVAALEQAVRTARQASPNVRAISDLREAGVQTAPITERATEVLLRLFVPGDRVAVIVQSILLKMQMRRVLNVGTVEFFLSRSEAENWVAS